MLAKSLNLNHSTNHHHPSPVLRMEDGEGVIPPHPPYTTLDSNSPTPLPFPQQRARERGTRCVAARYHIGPLPALPCHPLLLQMMEYVDHVAQTSRSLLHFGCREDACRCQVLRQGTHNTICCYCIHIYQHTHYTHEGYHIMVANDMCTRIPVRTIVYT